MSFSVCKPEPMKRYSVKNPWISFQMRQAIGIKRVRICLRHPAATTACRAQLHRWSVSCSNDADISDESKWCLRRANISEGMVPEDRQADMSWIQFDLIDHATDTFKHWRLSAPGNALVDFGAPVWCVCVCMPFDFFLVRVCVRVCVCLCACVRFVWLFWFLFSSVFLCFVCWIVVVFRLSC